MALSAGKSAAPPRPPLRPARRAAPLPGLVDVVEGQRQEGLHGPVRRKLGDPLPQHLDRFRVLPQGPIRTAQTEERATPLLVGQTTGGGPLVERYCFPLAALDIVQPRHLVVGLGVVWGLLQNAREQRLRFLVVSG